MIFYKNISLGFSFIELILVISIVSIIASASTPFLSSYLLRANVSDVSDKTVSTLRKAQSYAIDSKNGVVWGVCFTSGNIRLYRGTCASPTVAEDFAVPSNISVTGLSDITFSELRGEPSSSLNISISTNIENRTIQLNSAGGLTIT